MKAAFRRLVARIFEHQVRRVIARHHVKVVAVAGSIGKTSTRMAIAAVLSRKFRTLVHDSNYNSEIGLPLSVFNLRVPRHLMNPLPWLGLMLRAGWQVHHYRYEVVVLELGTDAPGDLAVFARYLKPDVLVVTAITPEHMAAFPGGLDEVAREELTLAPQSKIIIYNADLVPAPYVKQYLARLKHVHRYSQQDAGALPRQLRVLGHMRVPLLAARLVGQQLGVAERQIATALADIRPVAGRMNPLPGIQDTLIIDDTYNSSPDAVVAAMDTLAQLPAKGRRLALLGSMNALGDEAPRYHREAGAAAAGVDLLVTVGQLANHYLGPGALAAGLDPTRFKPADSPVAAASYLRLVLQPGDVLLVKGSQNGVFAEEAVKLLLANPADAAQLVRQSPAWMKLKRAQFPDLPRP